MKSSNLNEVTVMTRTDTLHDLTTIGGETGCAYLGVPAQFPFLKGMCNFYTEFRWRKITFELIFLGDPNQNGRIGGGFTRDAMASTKTFSGVLSWSGSQLRSYSSLGLQSSWKLSCPYPGQWYHLHPNLQDYYTGWNNRATGGAAHYVKDTNDIPWLFSLKAIGPEAEGPTPTKKILALMRVHYSIELRGAISAHEDKVEEPGPAPSGSDQLGETHEFYKSQGSVSLLSSTIPTLRAKAQVAAPVLSSFSDTL